MRWPWDLTSRAVVVLAALSSAFGAATTIQASLTTTDGHGVARHAQQPAVASSSPLSPHAALLKRYCVSCHNARMKTGGLALDTVDVDHPAENAAVWEKVVRKLRVRAMPPPAPGRPRPDDDSYEALVSYLEASLDRAAAAAPDPGRTDAFHRLSRIEYQHAVRDLLAVDVDASSLLPADDASHGFDNVNLAGLSPTLFDRYLSAAQKIARLAVGTPVPSPGARTVILPADLTQDDHFEQLPYGTRGGTIFLHTFPVDAEYSVQVRLTRDRNENLEGLSEAQQIEVTLDGERVRLFPLAARQLRDPSSDAAADAEAPADAGLVVRLPVKAGPHRVGVAFIKGSSALVESDRQPFTADYNGRRLAAIFSVSVAGPFNPTGPGETPSRQRIFVCRPAGQSGETACAAKIVSTLARRAFRRMPTDADVQKLLAFYQDSRAGGDNFETGIEMALRAILSSPEFLFRIERDPAVARPGGVYRINDTELASRLAAFLWSSIPDEALLDLAIRGKLHDPAVLEQQTRRMLADTRSEALITNFAEQWLYLRNLAAANPDPRLFPDFDDNLRQAFRRETELFVDSVKNEDRSVLELLNAKYTFVNERLAKHYGIETVYGSHFRRVALPDDSPRGGLLGQASILTVTSYATRTSPVQRGKWVLENLIGMPPPPPPGNVPPLKDSGSGGKVLSMRERMVEHRTNPACSGCHQLMDPIGLSTESFDAIGRWRDRSESGAPVDVSGALPDGSTFVGVPGLKTALLARPTLFVSTLTEKLLTYGLGRGLDYYDAPAVRAIVRDAARTDYRFSSIIAGIVKSVPFRMRRSE
jgi:mono/diheme cytochrome c family protein